MRKKTGLLPLVLPVAPTQAPMSPTAIPKQAPVESPLLPVPQKRKLSATDLEVPDSEAEDDEDYGWAEEDEEDIPPMPPQWQGSEDILVPPPGELEGEDEEGIDEEGDEPDEVADKDAMVRPGFRGEVVEDSEDELA